jgi:UTP--glucose-1-phosphate uridylyltransferase
LLVSAASLMETRPFYGFKFKGRTFDCGSKIGFLAANIGFALDRPDIAPDLMAAIDELLGK